MPLFKSRSKDKEKIADLKAAIQVIRDSEELPEVPAATQEDVDLLELELEELRKAKRRRFEEREWQKLQAKRAEERRLLEESAKIRDAQARLKAAPLLQAGAPSDTQAKAAASTAWAGAAQSWANASPWSAVAVMAVAAAGAFAAGAISNRDIQHSNNARQVALAANETERSRQRYLTRGTTSRYITANDSDDDDN